MIMLMLMIMVTVMIIIYIRLYLYNGILVVIQVLRNADGVGVGGVRFSGKKRYEGVMFNVISVTRVGGVPISRKIALRNTWMVQYGESNCDYDGHDYDCDCMRKYNIKTTLLHRHHNVSTIDRVIFLKCDSITTMSLFLSCIIARTVDTSSPPGVSTDVLSQRRHSQAANISQSQLGE